MSKPYIKLEWGFHRHIKLRGMPPHAKFAYVLSIEAAAETGRDGLFCLEYVQRDAGLTPEETERMFERGLWVDHGDGLAEVHDYLDYQTSQDQIETLTEKRRAAGQKSGQARRAKAQARPESGTKREQNTNKTRTNEEQNTNKTRTELELKLKLTPPTPPGGGSAREAQRPPRPPHQQAPEKLPDTWQPTPAHAELADTLRLDLAIEERKFRLWAREGPKTLTDWDARFERWLLATHPPKTPANQANTRLTPTEAVRSWDEIAATIWENSHG